MDAITVHPLSATRFSASMTDKALYLTQETKVKETRCCFFLDFFSLPFATKRYASRPEVGSSQIKTLGRVTNSVAIDTRRISPELIPREASSPMRECRTFSRPSSTIMALTIFCFSAYDTDSVINKPTNQ